VFMYVVYYGVLNINMTLYVKLYLG
jgi:hypothetical protein